MTAAELIAREREHVRCRNVRSRQKPQRVQQLILAGGTQWADLPWAYDPADFPGFTTEQIAAGLTAPTVRSEP